MTFDAKPCFSDTYAQSRQKFLSAATPHGDIHSFLHPEKGPDGGDLYLDMAVIGDAEANAGLVLISGTHGPEGFCGAGCQIALLESGLIDEFSDLRVVLIHAHNPYGFAWLRRTDHENIDLNRNYYDFSKTFTPHPGYDILRPHIVPRELDMDRISAGMAEYEAEHGKVGLLAAMVTGQSHDADGLFYRGSAPTWSQKIVTENLPGLLEAQDEVSVIDFHTGLGPFGVPYIVHGYAPGTEAFKAFRRAYGDDVKSTEDPADIDENMPATPEGPIVLAFDKILPGKSSYAVVIEYGTYPPDRVFPVLMKDNWLHAYGDLDSVVGREIKAEIKEIFYPASDKWKDMIWDESVKAMRCSAKLVRDKVLGDV
ncbi:MAG: DUF2817 domain-containing protein [Henriciella sp.]|nr:DUF2817 domain-containing protein [Henriciella sp.]